MFVFNGNDSVFLWGSSPVAVPCNTVFIQQQQPLFVPTTASTLPVCSTPNQDPVPVCSTPNQDPVPVCSTPHQTVTVTDGGVFTHWKAYSHAHSCDNVTDTASDACTDQKHFIKCPDCDASFALLSQYDDHQQSYHARLKRFRCKQCPSVFTYGCNLHRHIRTKHPQTCTAEAEGLIGVTAAGVKDKTSKDADNAGPSARTVHSESADLLSITDTEQQDLKSVYVVKTELQDFLFVNKVEAPDLNIAVEEPQDLECVDSTEMHSLPCSDVQNCTARSKAHNLACTTHLNGHQKSGKGRRPFHCAVCGYRFGRSYHLKRHLRNVHRHTTDRMQENSRQHSAMEYVEPANTAHLESSDLTLTVGTEPQDLTPAIGAESQDVVCVVKVEPQVEPGDLECAANQKLPILAFTQPQTLAGIEPLDLVLTRPQDLASTVDLEPVNMAGLTVNGNKKVDRGKKPFHCLVCRCEFQKSCHLKQHQNAHKHIPGTELTSCGLVSLTEYTNRAVMSSDLIFTVDTEPNALTHTVGTVTQDLACTASLESKDLVHLTRVKGHKKIVKSKSKGPFQCPVCRCGFGRSYHLKRHLKSVHRRTSQTEFTDVGPLSPTENTNHASVTPFANRVCSMSPPDLFSTVDTQPNALVHTVKTVTHDLACTAGLKSKDLAHLTRVKSHKKIVRSKSKGPFQCPVCRCGFGRSYHLKRHLKSVHKRTSQTEFTDVGPLSPTENTNHVSVTPFANRVCSMSPDLFLTVDTQPNALVHTVRTVTHDLACTASLESKDLAHLTSMKGDKRSDTSESKRPFQCPVCGSGFGRSYHLKRHLKSVHKHTETDLTSLGPFSPTENSNHAQLFVSTTCSTSPDQAVTDATEPNGVAPTVITKSQYLACTINSEPEDSAESNRVKGHKKTERDGRPFRCPVCRYRFGRSYHLKRHLKNVHKRTKTEIKKIRTLSATSHAGLFASRIGTESPDLILTVDTEPNSLPHDYECPATNEAQDFGSSDPQVLTGLVKDKAQDLVFSSYKKQQDVASAVNPLVPVANGPANGIGGHMHEEVKQEVRDCTHDCVREPRECREQERMDVPGRPVAYPLHLYRNVHNISGDSADAGNGLAEGESPHIYLDIAEELSSTERSYHKTDVKEACMGDSSSERMVLGQTEATLDPRTVVCELTAADISPIPFAFWGGRRKSLRDRLDVRETTQHLLESTEQTGSCTPRTKRRNVTGKYYKGLECPDAAPIRKGPRAHDGRSGPVHSCAQAHCGRRGAEDVLLLGTRGLDEQCLNHTGKGTPRCSQDSASSSAQRKDTRGHRTKRLRNYRPAIFPTLRTARYTCSKCQKQFAVRKQYQKHRRQNVCYKKRSQCSALFAAKSHFVQTAHYVSAVSGTQAELSQMPIVTEVQAGHSQLPVVAVAQLGDYYQLPVEAEARYGPYQLPMVMVAPLKRHEMPILTATQLIHPQVPVTTATQLVRLQTNCNDRDAAKTCADTCSDNSS